MRVNLIGKKVKIVTCKKFIENQTGYVDKCVFLFHIKYFFVRYLKCYENFRIIFYFTKRIQYNQTSTLGYYLLAGY